MKSNEGPIALVLAPTRELAQQIHRVVTEFGASSNIRSLCLCGGIAKVYQLAAINKGCDIAIATPGRLIDLLDDGSVNLKQCSYVVLDEGKFRELLVDESKNKTFSHLQPIICWNWVSWNRFAKLYHRFVRINNY